MDELSFSLYLPLVVLAFVALVVFIAAQLVGSGERPELSEKLHDVSFAIALLGSIYVAVLLVISLVSEPDVIYDIILTMLIVFVFFAVLLLLLFGVFELLFSRGRPKATPTKSD